MNENQVFAFENIFDGVKVTLCLREGNFFVERVFDDPATQPQDQNAVNVHCCFTFKAAVERFNELVREEIGAVMDQGEF